MSLIHWWPLNGNLNDYGINNNTLANNGSVTFSGAGKIGQCASVTSGKYLSTSDSLFNSYTCLSVSYWMKLNEEPSSDWYDIWSVGDFRAEIYSGHYMWTGYSDDVVSTASIAVEPNIWIHFVHVLDVAHKTYKIYRDGVQIRDISFTSTQQLTGAGIVIGQGILNIDFNDFRIYNHALSAKEIKEISKGLVLHYNFEDAYAEGTTNIDNVKDTGPSFSWTELKERVVYQGRECWHYIISGSTSGWFGAYSSETGFAENTILTRSCWLNIPEQQDRTGWYGLPFAFEGMADILSIKSYDLNKMGTWQHCYCVGKAASTNSNFLIYMIAGSDATFRIEFYMADIQTEQKDHATPYVNGTRPNGLIYDNSGYGYNGTQNGNLQILEDSPSGEKSAKFNSNIYVDIPTLPEFAEVSYAFWIKIPTATEAYRSIFNVKENPTGGLWLSLNTEGQGLWSYYASSPSYSGISGFISADTWIHCVFVFKDGYANWYKNGEYMGRDVYYPNLPKIPSNHYCLGDSYTGSSWDGTPFDGQIADFKIYSTALSAEDILLEYNRKASIDKNGNLFAPYVKEYETTRNIGELANYYIETQHAFDGRFGPLKESDYNVNYPNGEPGLGTYDQGNLIVTMTNQGIRIYSEPNRDGRAIEGSEWNTWGGFCWSPMKQSRCLIKGHHYRLSWHVKGQSSRAMVDVYWSNQIGWGQYPDASPTVHKMVTQPANFQGEMDCFYDFTIEDDIFKTTTNDVHAGFEPNTSYLAYSAFKIGYTYDFTGPLGTDIYITNLQLHDLTTGEVYKIEKSGIVKTIELVSGRRNSARLHSDGVIDVTDIIEY